MTSETPTKVHNPSGEFEATIEQATLDADAARLRAMRMSYRQIGEQQGVTTATAYKRVQRAIAAVPVESVNELRRVEMELLDNQTRDLLLIARNEKASYSERVAAYREIRQYSESRRKLMGIDVPATVNVTVNDAMTQEIEALAAELGINDPELGHALVQGE